MSSKRKRLENSSKPTTSSTSPTPEELAQRLFKSRKPSRQQVEQVKESGIVLQDNGNMRFQRFELSAVGLNLPEDTTAEEWQQMGRILLRLQARLQWLLGDWLAFGEQHQWGETYRQLADEFSYEVATLHNLASISRRVEFSRRRENLSFGHHETVASLKPEKQNHWLTIAEEESLTRNELRKRIRDSEKETPNFIEPCLTEEEIKVVRSAVRLLTTFADDDLKNLEGKQRKQAIQSIEALETLAGRLRIALDANSNLG